VPYLAYHFLKGDGKAESDEEDDEEAIKEADKLGDEKLKETRIYKLYEKIQRPLLESSKKALAFYR